MPELELCSTRVEASGDAARLTGTIRTVLGESREIYYEVPKSFAAMLFDGADAFAPALLVPAMAAGVDLHLEPPLSARMLGQIETILDVLVRFHGFRRARVTARPRSGGEPGPDTAAAFSGGVDSTYTLMRAMRGSIAGVQAPRYLLFFKGLEQPLGRLSGVEASIAAVASVARRTGATLVVVETNLRELFDPNYELYYCGSALASASLAISCGPGTVLLPSGRDYGRLDPTGSHPLLDPLWSTERQRIVYEGAGARRVDKIEALVREWPESLEWLRVCLENGGGGANCGRCRKCARTMVVLELLGALPRAKLFPSTLPAGTFESLALDRETLLEEVTDFGRRQAPDHPVTQRLERTLARRRRRAAVRSLCQNTPALAGALDLVDRVRGTGRHHPE